MNFFESIHLTLFFFPPFQLSPLFILHLLFPGAPISYSMPQGDIKSRDLIFEDFTYDGKEKEGVLYGGLGQLTDGVIAPTNFRADPEGTGHKGFNWVGWRNDSKREPLEFLFKFDEVRNFSAVRFHASNSFSKEVGG